MKNQDKIVVTGMGILSPFGTGTEPFWNGLINGDCGISKITQFPVESDIYPCKIAAEVPEFDHEPWVPSDDPTLQGRYPKLVLTALGMAIKDAGLTSEKDVLRSCDLFLGSAQQTCDALEPLLERWVKEKDLELSPETLSFTDPHAVIAVASKKYGICGRAINLTSSCTSGILALMLCVEYLRFGRSEVSIAIGAEAISPITFMGAGLTGELTKRNNEPEHASRPFDRDQDGYVLGEGAVALVVEKESHARVRGANIYAELGPFAATTDATSFKYIDEQGDQIARGIRMVLDLIPPSQIDYVNAHGPSIIELDTAESVAIRRAFREHADRIPVTSIKGAIGNPSAAGGLHQVVSSILSIRDGIIPPTINLENPLPGCDLDYVKSRICNKQVNTVLVSGHGGGGLNAAMTIHAYT